MNKILEEIISSKRRKPTHLFEDKKAHSGRARNPGKIVNTIKKGNYFIAEIKRGSPSKGLFSKDIDIIRQAQSYIEGGANAISVLTERDHFLGSPEDLIKIRNQFPEIPILRKDFITEEEEIIESAEMGADIVLLIARVLKESLANLIKVCSQTGIVPLIEIHSKKDIEYIQMSSSPLIGINTRDLDTFNLDMNLPLELIPEIPDSVAIIIESGITETSVKLYKGIGISGFLIGESLIKSRNPEVTLKRIRGSWEGL